MPDATGMPTAAEVLSSLPERNSLAQEIMRSDAATLSQEGFKQRRDEELVLDIVGESSLRLSPLEWDAVRSLVRAGVQAGRELEREA